MKNNDYIKWVRNEECVVCSTVSQCLLPEKYRGGGMKRIFKPVRDNDASAIPVCELHGDMIEKLSEIEWKRVFILGKAIFYGSAKFFYDKYMKFAEEE